MGLRVLIIKTSSLGDVVHGLAVVSDIQRRLPSCQIDWVVEEPYGAIVSLNGNVEKIISTRIRKWRTSLFSIKTWKEIYRVSQHVRAVEYDAVIDMQGLLKSALITKLARGKKYGFDRKTAREGISAFFYDTPVNIKTDEHMVMRCRKLTARALDYELDTLELSYQLQKPFREHVGRTAIILCGSAKQEKLWDETSWVEVVGHLIALGVTCKLIWGSEEERLRCSNIQRLSGGEIAPECNLDELALMLGRADLVVGLDTGLLHLAAAYEIPVVAIFGGSHPSKTGPLTPGLSRVVGTFNSFPSSREVIDNINSLLGSLP